MRLENLLPVGFSTLLVLVACSKETQMKPGKYEFDLQMSTEAGLNFTGIRGKFCLKADDVKYGDPKVDTSIKDGTCSISNFHSSGRATSYEFSCPGSSAKDSSRSVELTVVSESAFKTKAKHKVSGDTVTVTRNESANVRAG